MNEDIQKEAKGIEALKSRRWYPVVYMFVAMLVFSSVIIGFSRYTGKRVRMNEKIALERAVLEALGENATELAGAEVHARFTELVAGSEHSGGTGAYTFVENGVVKAYAVHFAGKGFWAPIKGFVGVAADRRTLLGIAFYEQSETPGLGAEIVKPVFRNQFIGRRLSSDARPIAFRRTGGQLGDNEVEAVTGATQTCTRLEKIINDAVDEWRLEIGSMENRDL